MDTNVTKLGYDLTFELNSFGQPRIRSEIEMIKNIVLYVILSKPGQYPSLPNIGLDIESLLYSDYETLDVEELKKQIYAQCNALGTYFGDNTIQVQKTIYNNKPSLLIHIDGSDILPDNDEYLIDANAKNEIYMIGITFDDLDQLLYNINSGIN
jgi:hypothetical protein